jgi:hypothetical protein
VTFSAWLDLPGVKTPADLAHGFMETRKPPHHNKVQSRGSKTGRIYGAYRRVDTQGPFCDKYRRKNSRTRMIHDHLHIVSTLLYLGDIQWCTLHIDLEFCAMTDTLMS